MMSTLTPSSRRIVITADPELPVPPRLYGGIERVIALLADGLSTRGHDVTLVAHRDSVIAGRLVPYSSRATSGAGSILSNAVMIARTVARAQPDIVHSFGRLATLGPILLSPTPKVMSYQRAVTPGSIEWGRRLSRNTLTFVACSRRLVRGLESTSDWRVVYNAVDVGRYAFAPTVSADAPLVFLGRIEPIKGPHIAIAAARRARRRLVLAGNVPAGHQAYFDQEIRPHLAEGAVTYAGPVDDGVKSELLSHAAALLMPVLWEEPFGIVMAEALACGTPVVGFARGAVPEVIEHGVTGFVCRDEREMDQALTAVVSLSRAACRLSAEERFSQQTLVDGYEAIYEELIAGRQTSPAVAGQPVLIRRRQ